MAETQIKWAYCAADVSKNGTVATVDADMARILVAEGRATYAEKDEAKPTGAKTK